MDDIEWIKARLAAVANQPPPLKPPRNTTRRILSSTSFTKRRELSRSDSGTSLNDKIPPSIPSKPRYLSQTASTNSDSCRARETPIKPEKFNDVSVKSLKELWENIAKSHGWESSQSIKLDIQKKTHSKKDVTVDRASDKVGAVTETEASPAQASSKFQLLNSLSKCDMVVCGIKTITVNDIKMHQVELTCHHCASSFIMTAVHECDDDENMADCDPGIILNLVFLQKILNQLLETNSYLAYGWERD